MTDRYHMIEWLSLWTKYNKQYFEKFSDEEIEKMYVKESSRNGVM